MNNSIKKISDVFQIIKKISDVFQYENDIIYDILIEFFNSKECRKIIIDNKHDPEKAINEIINSYWNNPTIKKIYIDFINETNNEKEVKAIMIQCLELIEYNYNAIYNCIK